MKQILNKFSTWTPCSERQSLPLKLPGVYMLAEFEAKAPSGKPTLASGLIYIGETCGQTLHQRLYQFNRSGFQDKLAHSGGKTFALRDPKCDPSRLFVSVMPVELETPQHTSAFIRYAERALLWAHVEQHGDYPECNSK